MSEVLDTEVGEAASTFLTSVFVCHSTRHWITQNLNQHKNRSENLKFQTVESSRLTVSFETVLNFPSIQTYLLFSGLSAKRLFRILHISNAYYNYVPPNYALFYVANYTLWRMQVMRSSLCYVRINFSTPCSQTPSLCSYLAARDKFETHVMDKIVVL